VQKRVANINMHGNFLRDIPHSMADVNYGGTNLSLYMCDWYLVRMHLISPGFWRLCHVAFSCFVFFPFRHTSLREGARAVELAVSGW